jgi:hypothetical protein
MKIIAIALAAIAAVLMTATVPADEGKQPPNPFTEGPLICLPIELVRQVAAQNEQQRKEIEALRAELAALKR